MANVFKEYQRRVYRLFVKPIAEKVFSIIAKRLEMPISEAIRAIEVAFPDAEFERTDFDRTVSVRRPGMDRALRIAYAARPTRGETEADAIVPTLDSVLAIIEALAEAEPIRPLLARGGEAS